MLCASIGTKECFEILLGFGPYINATDKFGRSAIHFACQRGDKDIFLILSDLEETDIDL